MGLHRQQRSNRFVTVGATSTSSDEKQPKLQVRMSETKSTARALDFCSPTAYRRTFFVTVRSNGSTVIERSKPFASWSGTGAAFTHLGYNLLKKIIKRNIPPLIERCLTPVWSLRVPTNHGTRSAKLTSASLRQIWPNPVGTFAARILSRLDGFTLYSFLLYGCLRFLAHLLQVNSMKICHFAVSGRVTSILFAVSLEAFDHLFR